MIRWKIRCTEANSVQSGNEEPIAVRVASESHFIFFFSRDLLTMFRMALKWECIEFVSPLTFHACTINNHVQTNRQVSRFTERMCSAMSKPTIIQSVKNQRVKDARALLKRRQRDKENRILLEGRRLISDALDAGVTPHEIFYTEDATLRIEQLHVLRDKWIRDGAHESLVSDEVIRSFSDTVTPQVRCLPAFSLRYFPLRRQMNPQWRD